MTAPRTTAGITIRERVDAFVATYDRNDPTDRWIAARMLERLHGEVYRRERERCPEWIDLGGEG